MTSGLNQITSEVNQMTSELNQITSEVNQMTSDLNQMTSEVNQGGVLKWYKQKKPAIDGWFFVDQNVLFNYFLNFLPGK